MTPMTHVSLFSGIGGIDLAAEWARFETIAFCERDKYCQKILNKHWPDVPVIEDIHDVTADRLIQYGIDSRNITLVSGGFPCQPFSVAGKQAGKDDDRYLWPEMLRVIRELKPAWVLGENVPGIINMALDEVCINLEAEGYEVQPLIIPACGVGAWHRRARVFIVAHATSRYAAGNSREFQESNEFKKKKRQEKWLPQSCSTSDVSNTDCRGCGSWRPECAGQFGASSSPNGGNDVSDANNRGLQNRWAEGSYENRDISDENVRSAIEKYCGTTESRLGGMVDGFSYWMDEPAGIPRVTKTEPSKKGTKKASSRVHRLRALGNAVVPQQVFPILQAIAMIENKVRGNE